MLDNDDVKHLLLNIRRQTLEPPGATVDERYVAALGLIVGICGEAIRSVNERRPAHFETFLRPPR